jgi:ligand-binding SRPBCC domain-containing protein
MEDLVVNRSGAPATAGAPFFCVEPISGRRGYSDMHELRTSIILSMTLEEAWAFFSVPDNLDEITPADMKFEILTQNEKRTYAGQIIRYRVRPLFNVPMHWVTEITHCEQGKYFVDEQRFGPYAMWHHQHHFKPVEGGVQMDDILHYKLRGGWMGDALTGWLVHGKVRAIFSHRTEVLLKRFGGVDLTMPS